MRTKEYSGWKFEYDRTKTIQAYQNIKISGPEICNCSFCKNFILARAGIYPETFLELLSEPGISLEKEAEVYHINKLNDDCHLYGGWYHFVGQILEVPSAKNTIRVNNFSMPDKTKLNSLNFDFSFTNKVELVSNEFKEFPVVQLEFFTKAPWIISERESV